VVTTRVLLAALLPAFLVCRLGAAPQPGQLCIADAPCVVAPAGERAVTPVPEPRTFTWTAASGARLVLGVIPASADHLSTDLAGVARLRLSSGDPARLSESTVTVRQDRLVWQFGLGAAQIKAGVELRLAAGAYELTAASHRHRPTTRALTIATAPVEVAITLAPLPQLTGRAIAKATGEPVPGAAITLPEGQVAAITDGTGRFAFDADPDHWPETIAIAAGGFGTVIMPVPRARAGADLLDIALSAGATLRVAIERDPAIHDVTLDLIKRRYDVPDPAPIATKTAVPEESGVTFDHVEEGTYVLIARGAEPRERFGMKFTMRSGEDRALTMALHPVHLALTTLMGETPLAAAQVRLSSTDGLWQEELRTGASGTADVTLWQLGKLTALVSAEPALTVPYLEERSFGGDADAEWTIHVSTREVRGVVVNAASGEPVPNANVLLEVKGRYSALARADADGRFVFTSAVPGEHAVSAAADGYQHDTIAYTFLESEQTHPVTVRLAPAASARVLVRDAAGSPLAGAAVLDFSGFTLMGERFSDERGEVTVPMRSGETRDVYVIPRDGSFAIGKISKAESVITMPVPQATIVVTARSTSNDPIPGVWVVLRYNGIPLPFEVQQAMARQQGATPVSGADGRIVLRHMPLGMYELWPVGSAGEARAAMTGLGEVAPVRIAARPGLNEALLQFAAK
jgi:hypothetical protein